MSWHVLAARNGVRTHEHIVQWVVCAQVHHRDVLTSHLSATSPNHGVRKGLFTMGAFSFRSLRPFVASVRNLGKHSRVEGQVQALPTYTSSILYTSSVSFVKVQEGEAVFLCATFVRHARYSDVTPGVACWWQYEILSAAESLSRHACP